MITVLFGERTMPAEIHAALDDDGNPTGRKALFARHAGQVGKGATVMVDTQAEAEEISKLGYRIVMLRETTN